MTLSERNECSRIRMAKTVSPIYRERRAKLIVYKGGRCEKCGLEYDGTNGCQFSFHHLGLDVKITNLTVPNMGKPWRFLKNEADKTQLLCLNCHAPHHSKEY